MKKTWKKISDSKVRHVWKSVCNCPDAVEEVFIPPTFFQDGGVPICQECGTDFEYVRTEILS
jgi:hypothetical protein